MQNSLNLVDEGYDNSDELFAKISADLQSKGYSINPAALPVALGQSLADHLCTIETAKFAPAAIGRQENLTRNNFVRADKIVWITGQSNAGKAWLEWAGRMQRYLNKTLFLGLFSFESHFAHYAVDAFYKRHLDAFKGQANRVLSLVVYLNPDWTPENAGELVIYTSQDDVVGIKVTPSYGTVVIFLSEEFSHEVIKTNRDRFSIAGWFRVNSSTSDRVDPPR